ncbi:hypothetical protein [Kitasatospora sp. NPDC050463]|uniref:hypothetical protein n=1 Tax=Kitasatospora sp. NPDC050463 TaxID=3155786 RepID=UPI0033F75E56
MATIRSVTDNLAAKTLRPVPYSELERSIATFARPESAVGTAAITQLNADLLALVNSPVAAMGRDWDARQRHLLRAASLWSQQPPAGLASQVFQRASEILKSVTGPAAERLMSNRPQDLTEADAQSVEAMVEGLMPISQGLPDDEARSWVIDLVAVWFFAPCTEAIDEASEEDAMALVITGLETAFSAAEFAGTLWDQARGDG